MRRWTLSALLAIAVGAPAPHAAVQTLDGQAANLSTYIGHRPAVIEFWAKWCPNCRELEPALQAAARRYTGRVAFVTVAVAVDETPAEVARYARQKPFVGPVLYDDTGAAVEAYDVPGTSYLVVINAKGTVVYAGSGGAPDVDAAVRKAL